MKTYSCTITEEELEYLQMLVSEDAGSITADNIYLKLVDLEPNIILTEFPTPERVKEIQEENINHYFKTLLDYTNTILSKGIMSFDLDKDAYSFENKYHLRSALLKLVEEVKKYGWKLQFANTDKLYFSFTSIYK